AWVTERKNVLSASFYLAALLAYFRFSPALGERKVANRDTAGLVTCNDGGWQWYAVALLLFVCALLSKTVTSTLPAAIVLLLWWKRGRVGRRDALALAPMFALGVALGLMTIWVEKHYVGAEGDEFTLTAVERVLIAGRALWFYAGKLLYPMDLTFIYRRWRLDPSDWRQYFFPVSAIAVPAALWLLRRRIGYGPLVAVAFFAGTLVPALGFFDVYPMRYS